MNFIKPFFSSRNFNFFHSLTRNTHLQNMQTPVKIISTLKAPTVHSRALSAQRVNNQERTHLSSIASIFFFSIGAIAIINEVSNDWALKKLVSHLYDINKHRTFNLIMEFPQCSKRDNILQFLSNKSLEDEISWFTLHVIKAILDSAKRDTALERFLNKILEKGYSGFALDVIKEISDSTKKDAILEGLLDEVLKLGYSILALDMIKEISNSAKRDAALERLLNKILEKEYRLEVAWDVIKEMSDSAKRDAILEDLLAKFLEAGHSLATTLDVIKKMPKGSKRDTALEGLIDKFLKKEDTHSALATIKEISANSKQDAYLKSLSDQLLKNRRFFLVMKILHLMRTEADKEMLFQNLINELTKSDDVYRVDKIVKKRELEELKKNPSSERIDEKICKTLSQISDDLDFQEFKNSVDLSEDINYTDVESRIRSEYRIQIKTHTLFKPNELLESNLTMPGIALIAAYLMDKKKIQGLFVCTSEITLNSKIKEIATSSEDQKCAIIFGSSEGDHPGHKMAICIEKKGAILNIGYLDSGGGFDVILCNKMKLLCKELNCESNVFFGANCRQFSGGGCSIFALQDAVGFLQDDDFFKKIKSSTELNKGGFNEIKQLPLSYMRGTQSLSRINMLMLKEKVGSEAFKKILSNRKKTFEDYLDANVVLKDGIKLNKYIAKKKLKYEYFVVTCLKLMESQEIKKAINSVLIK